jgi:hypothetical protein
MVRLKIKCKNPSKIPMERVLEIQDDLFLLAYKVEGYTQKQKSTGKDDGDEDDDSEEDEEEDLLKENLEDLNNTKAKDQEKETGEKEEGSSSAPTNNVGRGKEGNQQELRKNVKEKNT